MDLRDKARQESFAQVSISNNIAISLVSMLQFAEAVRQIGPRFRIDSGLAQAIEQQVTLLAGFSVLAGLDPGIARSMGDAALDHAVPLNRLDEIAKPLLRYTNAAREVTVH